MTIYISIPKFGGGDVIIIKNIFFCTFVSLFNYSNSLTVNVNVVFVCWSLSWTVSRIHYQQKSFVIKSAVMIRVAGYHHILCCKKYILVRNCIWVDIHVIFQNLFDSSDIWNDKLHYLFCSKNISVIGSYII